MRDGFRRSSDVAPHAARRAVDTAIREVCSICRGAALRTESSSQPQTRVCNAASHLGKLVQGDDLERDTLQMLSWRWPTATIFDVLVIAGALLGRPSVTFEERKVQLYGQVALAEIELQAGHRTTSALQTLNGRQVEWRLLLRKRAERHRASTAAGSYSCRKIEDCGSTAPK
eukprot:7388220-Prymnesium_polylepis.3